MMTVKRATITDLGEVLAVLGAATQDMHRRGIDQWRDGFDADRIGPYVARAEMYLVHCDEQPVATVRADSEADPDFWTASEAAELALYVSKLARIPEAPAGTGEILLRWIVDRAAQLGYRWVRLDAWRTNKELHKYYLDRGWDYLRTVPAPGRRSGALFQRPAAPDLDARAALTEEVIPATLDLSFINEQGQLSVPDLG